MQIYTLCYPIDDDSVLLGYKRRGHGKDLYCGFGGKLEKNETLVDCIIRELEEESGIQTSEKSLSYSGAIKFQSSIHEIMNGIVHVFIINDWEGKPNDTEEMYPQWFKINNMPYNFMRETDIIWLPYVLSYRKLDAEFYYEYNKDSEKVSGFNVTFSS